MPEDAKEPDPALSQKERRRYTWPLLSALFAFLTFAVSIWNFAEARRLTATLSTHYVGSFPASLPGIGALVAGSSRSLLIACDLPGYGIYSAYDS